MHTRQSKMYTWNVDMCANAQYTCVSCNQSACTRATTDQRLNPTAACAAVYSIGARGSQVPVPPPPVAAARRSCTPIAQPYAGGLRSLREVAGRTSPSGRRTCSSVSEPQSSAASLTRRVATAGVVRRCGVGARSLASWDSHAAGRSAARLLSLSSHRHGDCQGARAEGEGASPAAAREGARALVGTLKAAHAAKGEVMSGGERRPRGVRAWQRGLPHLG